MSPLHFNVGGTHFGAEFQIIISAFILLTFKKYAYHLFISNSDTAVVWRVQAFKGTVSGNGG
jgi:hypothetical protein